MAGTITGGIKFFEKSKSLFVKGATATASSNNDAARNILTSNKFIRWVSFGSNDTITETIEITFENATIDRIFLIDTNFKEFTVKYDVGGVPTDFTNVAGLDGVLSAIAESAYSKDTAYYEFDSVTTTKIYITATTTQTPNKEKSLVTFYCTEEIGTLEGYPVVAEDTLNNNINKKTTLSGKINPQKRLETFKTVLKFKDYTARQNDYDIIVKLHERIDSYLIWLPAGKYGDSFSMVRRNWDLKDIYNVQTMSALKAKWNGNIYLAGFSVNLQIEEVTEA
jgi:hypothetical protein